MRRAFVSTCVGLVVIVTASACTTRNATVTMEHVRPVPATRSGIISAEKYLSHITVLAHDSLEGRGTGSHGIDIAAGYIAGQFAAAGLEPGGVDGTFFQTFVVRKTATLSNESKLTVEGIDDAPELRDDFIPFGFSARGAFEGDVVFLGYGISAPEHDHDDYANVETDGKIALMLRREPSGWSEQGHTTHASFESKIKRAEQAGATAVLIVNQDPGEDGIDALMRFRSRGDVYGLPTMHVTRELADRLLSAGGLSTIADLQKRLDDSSECVSATLDSVGIAGTVAYDSEEMIGRNVIGLLPGTGPHANEYVVIGGHYDHLGIRGDRIYNGADDNASGTAGVIELARVFAHTPKRDRSILFMAYSGEEMGLLGSKHYANNPTVPIEAISVMVNMDMIGRWTPHEHANMLAIQGLGTGNAFKEIVSRRTEEHEIEYIPDESARGPSDHASFYGVGIPSLFFFTGVHDDYHQPGDDTEKVNAEGAVAIASLIFDIASDLVNLSPPIQFAEVSERANIFRGAAPQRQGVVMGIMPAQDDDSDLPGWKVERVFPGTGAANAGMKDGDRIIGIDGNTVGGMRDYFDVVSDKNPGDHIAVKVRRGKEELTLDVELSSRGSRPGAGRP